MLLIAVFSMVAVGGIMSGVAIQEWSVVEKREREAQLLFIQEQFAAAIVNYQADQGALPATLEQLTKKGQKGQMFLRKEYTDPMFREAKLEDWCLLKVGAGNRVVSSCSAEGQEGGANALGLGSGFRMGQESRNPRARPTPGQAAGAPGAIGGGGVGIVGVASKSTDQAFNTVKRQEETYDQWVYTFEDYKKEMAQRGIPGLNQQQGPGFGQKPGQGRPGQMGGDSDFGSGFNRPGSGKSGGSGSSPKK